MDILKNGEIMLSGVVGEGLFEGDFFTYADVVDALAAIGRNKDVTVHINSGGGVATEGIAIFNALESHKGRVTVIVESIAASAASLIAMAGDEVIMRSGSMMMIHDPSSITVGNLNDHTKTVERLEAIAASAADIYAEKTGRSVKDIREEMKSEIWMTAREAVAKGYADKVDKARSKEPTAFDYRIYNHAPERMVALAESRGWRHPGATAQSAADHGQRKDDPMTDSPTAAAPSVADPATAPAPAPAVAEPAQTVAAAADIDAAVKAERKRNADITAMCKIAGKPDKAVAFIEEGKSLSEVVTALQADRVTAAAADTTTRHTAQADKPASLDKFVDKVNARFSNGRAA